MRAHSSRNWGDYATGAVPHQRDPRDYRMEHIPGVAAQAEIGVPESYTLAPLVKSIYTQGTIPCCVMASIALMESIQDQIDRGAWRVYDFLEAYHSVGGNGREGVPARAALEYAQDTGLRVVGRQARHRIASYQFAPQEPESFVSTLKASLAANRPCVLACRLPSKFGWDSGGIRTPAYHQLCLIGYDPANAIVANSWGNGWGRYGLGRIPWGFLLADNLQNGDTYSYTATDTP